MLAYPTSLLSIPAHLHTYQRYVPDVLNLFIGIHDRGPTTRFYRLIPIAQTSLLNSTFPSPPSLLPHGRQVGVLKVKKGKKGKKESVGLAGAGLARSSDLHFSAFHPDALCA